MLAVRSKSECRLSGVLDMGFSELGPALFAVFICTVNPITATASQISGTESAHTGLQTVYFPVLV